MYLVSKEVEDILFGATIGMILLSFVLWVFRLEYLQAKRIKKKREEKNEPRRYWIEKIVKGDGEEVFKICSNYPIVNSNSEFYTLKETMDEIKHRKGKDLSKIEISREVVWDDSLPIPPEDRHIKQGEEPISKEYEAIKAMEGQIKNADPEYLKQSLVDHRTLEYLAHLDKKMENSDFFKQEEKRLEEIKNNLKPERDWFENGGDHLS